MDKIAGIVCDNYKLEKFKEELNNEGFTDFEVKSLKGDASVIKVKTTPKRYHEIYKLCKQVELWFKTRN